MAKTGKLCAAGALILISTAAVAGDDSPPLPPRGIAYKWTPEQQIVGYSSRMMIDIVRVVGKGGQVVPTPRSVRQISPHWTYNGRAFDVDRYFDETRTSGLIVLKNGKIIFERYGLGRTDEGYWDIQSTSKSVTALLIGAAIQDGYIKGMDSLVTDYIPDLKGSAYDGVTIRQLATMTSGVKWDEEYVDPKGLGSQQWKEPFVNGVDPTVSFMRRLPRVSRPGATFTYSSADADLAGILVSNAVGRSLAEYLSDKLWRPLGMEHQAYCVVDPAGRERGGCCLSVTLRDFARIGQFVLDGGKVGGKQVVSPEWLVAATSTQVPLSARSDDSGAVGYGYFWWVNKQGFMADGHAGQRIFVFPKDNLVIAINSAWLEPTQPNRPDYQQLIRSLVEAIRSDAKDIRT